MKKSLRITIGMPLRLSMDETLDHLNRVRAGTPSEMPVSYDFPTWKLFFEHFTPDRLEVLTYVFRYEPISEEAVTAGLGRNANTDITDLLATGDLGREADGRLWYGRDPMRAEIMIDYPITAIEVEPILTDEDHRRTLAEIDRLMDLNPAPRSTDSHRLDILSLVAKAFEEEHYPIAQPDPIEAIQFAIEQRNPGADALAFMAGGRDRLTQLLRRESPLNLDQIRALSVGLGIPLEVLVREYPLRN